MPGVRNFITGAGFAFDGIRLFYQMPQLWKYAAFPLLLILFTYGGMVAAGWYLIKFLSDFFAEKCADLPGFLQWLPAAASSAAAIGVILLVSVIAVVSIGTLYELFGGLFFDALIRNFAGNSCPEKLENSDWKFNTHAIIDSIVYSINTLLIMLAAVVLNLFLPFIGEIIGFIVISYRFGVSYLAMCGFHYRKNMLQTRNSAYRNFMLTLGYGVSIYLIFLFPLAVVFALPGLIIGGVRLYNVFNDV
jgi:CysZ protein